MKTKLYALKDEHNKIRYIGKTSKSLQERLTRHIWSARNDTTNNYKSRWIRTILTNGGRPTIMLIGEVEGNGCAEEIAYIAYFKAEQFQLVNTTAGGEGTRERVVSQETREKTRSSLMGHSVSVTTRLKQRRAKLGCKRAPHSEATKNKMRLAALNRPPFTAQHRRNLSIAHTKHKTINTKHESFKHRYF